MLLPALSVTTTGRLFVAGSNMPASDRMVWLAVQTPLLLTAATIPPPNALKSTVTVAMSALASPPAVLFHVTVTVSPITKRPPGPLAVGLMVVLATLTLGAETSRKMLSAVPTGPATPFTVA